MEKFIQNSKSLILYLLIFLFPLFFLNSTQEFFITNKLYLLAFGSLVLLLLSPVYLLLSKKISWQKRPFDNLVLLFLATIALSTLFSSPNKIQALLNPNFGLIMMIFLTILYFYLSRVVVIPSPSTSLRINSVEGSKKKISPLTLFGRNDTLLLVSLLFLSVLTIVFFFQPFKNVSLPQNFAFLKNPSFTPLGSQLDLAIFLGFFVVWGIVSFPRRWESRLKWIPVFTGMTLIINLLALFLTVYSLLNNQSPVTNNQSPILILPPFRLSWYAALEVLKNPQTAFLGVGVDNFSSVFTRVKDLAYNQSSLWQINSFNVSRSAILQIFTETGILGLASFGLLIFNVFRVIPAKAGIQSKISIISLFLYLLICLFIFPPSLIIWFLFFITLATLGQEGAKIPVLSFFKEPDEFGGGVPTKTKNTGSSELDLSNLLPIYLGITVISFLLIAGAGYFLGRSYASEYYFKKSLDGIVKNNLKEVYDNQRQAIILNPYIERFRSNFAQTNFIIANNLVQKEAKEITEQDKQSVTQAIQAGIAEAKAVTSLNPQKADNWKNLAVIYRNIINIAQGSDVWTISAYQRAIIMDPKNPLYRVDLGGVYYSLGKYDEAAKFFEQAISLKPDWPNAQYNYAWANFQKGNYPQAASAMQNVLNLLDPKLNKTDYEKAQKDLEEFKKKLPEAR